MVLVEGKEMDTPEEFADHPTQDEVDYWSSGG